MLTEWKLKESDSAEELSRLLGVTSLTARLLCHRGMETVEAAKQFLSGTLEDLQDPYLLKDMEKAVQRLIQAIDQSELIIVHGDYDVDGITASAIVGRTLNYLGANWKAFVPHRVKNGYGFTSHGVEFAKKEGAKIIVTLDCGTVSFDEVKEAQAAGIDCLIFDHHQVKDGVIPEAHSLVNPHQEDCTAPFGDYCATGLAYKIAEALIGDKAKQFLDFAALGTVGDMVPLVGDNRLFVKYGLKAMSQTPNLPFKTLAESAKLRTRRFNVGHLGFIFGPRINASGRMESGEPSLNLLLSDNVEESQELAAGIEKQNKERKRIEQLTTRQAIKKVEMEVNFNKDRVIVVWDESWHPGVIGIVAARLVERFHRPSLVISVVDGKGKGSGRSISKVNLYELLKQASNPLEQFGGHAQAVGLSIEQGNLEEFRRLINEVGQEWVLTENLSKTFNVDAEISFKDLDLEQMKEIAQLEPFGLKNPKPVFLTKNVELKRVPTAYYNKYETRFMVNHNGVSMEAVGKNSTNPEFGEITQGVFDIIYSPALKIWEGREVYELTLKDIKKA